jgi:hypothetical protein
VGLQRYQASGQIDALDFGHPSRARGFFSLSIFGIERLNLSGHAAIVTGITAPHHANAGTAIALTQLKKRLRYYTGISNRRIPLSSSWLLYWFTGLRCIQRLELRRVQTSWRSLKTSLPLFRPFHPLTFGLLS